MANCKGCGLPGNFCMCNYQDDRGGGGKKQVKKVKIKQTITGKREKEK